MPVISFERGFRIRYFILSFTASFLVWAVLYLFLAVVVHPRTVRPAGAVSISAEEPYRPEKKDAVTVLFMGMRSSQSPPGAYLLARFDPSAGRVVLAALPGNMAVLNNGREESLEEVYAYGGVQYTRDLIAKTAAINVDRYVRLTPESFVACAEAIGSVEYLLPVSLTLRRDGAAVELQRGLQLLDGNKALSLLLHDYGTPADCLNALTAIAASVVEQRRDVILSTLMDSVFERVINRIDSDISYTDYLDRKAAGEYFAKLPGPVTKIIEISGAEENGIYRASDTFLAEVAQYFG